MYMLTPAAKKKAFEMQKAAKDAYEEWLAALYSINKDEESKKLGVYFDIKPSEAEFKRMLSNSQKIPTRIEFVARGTKSTFVIENRFFPHSSVFTVPSRATENECKVASNLVFEQIAQPKKAIPGYKPKMVLVFDENEKPGNIFSAIESAEKRGIEISAIFVGKQSEYAELDSAHSKKTKEVIASGKLENLPGYNGYVDSVKNSDGGRKGLKIMESYQARKEKNSTFRMSK